MSLHIGHLSPHARQDELEHVFRRFGRCSVQLKDGYGFAVYEVTANAERALRSLRGKIICGEQITLHWSNRQPRPFQRLVRSSRIYEPRRGTNFRQEDDGFRIRGTPKRKPFPAFNRPEHHINDVPDKEANQAVENKDTGENNAEKTNEKMMDGGGTSDPNPIENDRWGESGDDFDRYEPYHGYHKRDEKENFQKAGSYEHLHDKNSLGKGWQDHSIELVEKNIDRLKPQPTCYNCGSVGHMMRNCPQGEFRQEGFGFKHRRDEPSFRDRREFRMKRLRSDSWRRPGSIGDPQMLKPLSERARRVPRMSSPESRGKRKLHTRGNSRKDESKPEQDPKRAAKKSGARRTHRFSASSDSSTPSSQSHPQSKQSGSSMSSTSCSRLQSSRRRSRSRSRFRSHSASSSSKSAPASSDSQSKSSRSRSRFRSMSSTSFPISLSVSISPHQKSTPSPTSKQMNSYTISLKGNAEDTENTKEEIKHSNLDSEAAVVPLKAAVQTNGEYPMHIDDAEHLKTGCVESNPGTTLYKDAAATYEHQGQMDDHDLTRHEKRNGIKLTSEEVFSALRHYGLVMPEDGQADIPIEQYLGAARLWPWEMVYYRRLKKGPISTENYAKRLEQNREHGIVDKYIRSSSGWWEFNQTYT